MVRVNEDYIIEVDPLNYTVMRDAHRKTTRVNKSTGESVEVDAFTTVGYYGNLAEAIKGVIKDMNAKALKDGVHTLKEALEIVVNNNNRFYELLEKVLSIKEVSYDN